MEIDVTDFFASEDPAEFSASAFELGRDAGRITWSAAMAEAGRKPLLTTPEQLQALRGYMAGFGAWEDAEIEGWSATKCNALFIQEISCRMRELEALAMTDDGEVDWIKARELGEAGEVSGALYCGDNGRVYFSLSN